MVTSASQVSNPFLDGYCEWHEVTHLKCNLLSAWQFICVLLMCGLIVGKKKRRVTGPTGAWPIHMCIRLSFDILPALQITHAIIYLFLGSLKMCPCGILSRDSMKLGTIEINAWLLVYDHLARI